MNTIDQAIEVLQAMNAGKTIQVENGGHDGKIIWADRDEEMSDEMPDFYNLEYRVKPEPREWTMTACPTRHMLCDCSKNAICDGREMELVRVREILK